MARGTYRFRYQTSPRVTRSATGISKRKKLDPQKTIKKNKCFVVPKKIRKKVIPATTLSSFTKFLQDDHKNQRKIFEKEILGDFHYADDTEQDAEQDDTEQEDAEQDDIEQDDAQQDEVQKEMDINYETEEELNNVDTERVTEMVQSNAEESLGDYGYEELGDLNATDQNNRYDELDDPVNATDQNNEQGDQVDTLPINSPKERKQRQRTSFGWDAIHQVGDDTWQCKYCSRKPWIGILKGNPTISNVNSHIRNVHPEIAALLDKQSDQQKVVDINYKIMEWIARCSHSFSVVEEEELFTLFKDENKLLKRKQLVDKHLHQVYNNYKSVLMKKIHENGAMLALTSDGWTSSTIKGRYINCPNAHFIDKQWVPHLYC